MKLVARCALLWLFCLCYTGILYAATPFDDFSGSRIDSSKWKDRDWNGIEQVREVTGGKLILITGGPVDDPGACGTGLGFANPNDINTIEAKVSITEASIVGDNIDVVLANISGNFYEDVGGEVRAYLSLQYIGSGYEAIYQLQNSTGWSGDFFNLAIQTGTEYTLKIDYNPGTQEFKFSVNGEQHSIFGKARNGPPVNGSKGLNTFIIGDPNGGSGYLSATFDDVEVNNAPYDDFSGPLSSANWSDGETVREIRAGQLQMNIQNRGISWSSTFISMDSAQVTDYFQADVTIDSDTVLTGDNTNGDIIVGGSYYNSKYDGSNGYDNSDGEILVSVRVRQFSDGSLQPFALILRCEDASCDTDTELLKHIFSCDVQLDTPVTLAIEKKGPTLVFSCDQDQFSYLLEGTLYNSKSNIRRLRSRLVTDSAEGDYGYLKATVDNVYTKKSSPSSWMIYMPAILTGAQ